MTQIQQYTLQEKIGQGGFGEVYKTTDRLGRQVALKILLNHHNENQALKNAFINEAETLARFSHPNILKISDIGKHEGRPFYTSELQPINLGEFILDSYQVHYSLAIALTEDILSALAFFHEKEKVHGDIKPSNILLTDLDIERKPRAVLCDPLLVVNDPTITLTKQQAIGSVAYMAPEVAAGAQPDERSDIYSTGAVLYTMLTGNLAMGDLRERLEGNSHLPHQLRQAVLRSLNQNPDSRYQSIDEFLQALNKDSTYNKSFLPRIIRKKFKLNMGETRNCRKLIREWVENPEETEQIDDFIFDPVKSRVGGRYVSVEGGEIRFKVVLDRNFNFLYRLMTLYNDKILEVLDQEEKKAIDSINLPLGEKNRILKLHYLTHFNLLIQCSTRFQNRTNLSIFYESLRRRLVPEPRTVIDCLKEEYGSKKLVFK